MANEEIIETIKKQLADHEKRISEIEGLSQKKPALITKKISVKEFILSKKPESEIQKTLATGFYLEKFEGLSSFNVKDLEDWYRAAKEPLPKNMNDTVNKNISRGHIMDAKEKKDNKKAWVLTNSGEVFVESGFQEKK